MKRRTMLVSAAAVLLLLLIALIPGAALGAGVAYDDVQPGDWYYDAVQYVSDNGLMQGVGNNTFAPGDDVTRGMIVTIIYRLDGSPAVSGDCPFSDVAAGSWYEKAVTWAAANGIVNGYSAASFGPDDSITREQMALIFYNYAKYKGYDVTKTADISSFIDSNNVHDWARDAMSWCTAVGLINGMGGNALAPEGSSTRAQAAAVLMRFEQNVAGKTEPEPKPEPKPTPAPKPSSSSGSPVTSRVQHVAAPAVRENEIAATCEQAGSYDEVVYCSECGIELKRTANTIPALGHKWDEGVETVAPTCTEAGVKTYTCQNDASHTKTEAIAASGHKPAAAVKENEVAATCTKKGSYDEVVYCSVCQEELSRTAKTVKKLDHDYQDGVCTMCGEKQQYKVTFVDYDKTVIDVQTVAHGESAKAPADPKRSGYTFKGWDVAFDNIVSALTVTAQYESATDIGTDPAIVVNSVTAKPGDTQVEVTVSISNNPGILGMTLALDYDDAVLTLTGARNGAATSMLSMTKPGKFESGCKFVWDGQEIEKEDVKDGVILTLTFSVSGSAVGGTYPITISYKDGDIIDNDLATVDVKTVAGDVKIQSK